MTNPAPKRLLGRPCAVCSLPLAISRKLQDQFVAGSAVRPAHRWLQRSYPKETAHITYQVLARHKRLHYDGVNRAARKLSDGDVLYTHSVCRFSKGSKSCNHDLRLVATAWRS